MGVAVRRALLLGILLTLALPVTSAAAGSWLDWWLTPDQQGRLSFAHGDYLEAARRFEDRRWKAIAFDRAGDHLTAARLFAELGSAEDLFRSGNALARAERLPAAIEAYRRALALRPDFAEATFNLDWVEGLWALDQKTYDDAGGTGGKLAADRIVVDDEARAATGNVTERELRAQTGLSDEALRDMWMRRVQTTPGDFLRFKFAYQVRRSNAEGAQ